MSADLRLLNRQRTQSLDLRLLRRIVRHLLAEKLQVKDFDLTIQLVSAAEMTRRNETIMRHAGSTDVITLDYSDGKKSSALTGELFVCVDEAFVQARRFRVPWQSELLRYIIHGALHLRGYDDRRAGPRRRMKHKEDHLLGEMTREFNLSKLRAKTTLPP